uniref:Uncharacterized protein LOC111110670 isoform X1 n=1 Tax=Crassostrea virginica TaxID=6565 RepID=A0A8B8BJG1_CRAVI|nr:uncharacterized protein LOC111110670 isoform X1 [Crassostrea virginica]
MESSLLLLVFVSHITLCDSQAYAGRKFEIKATVPLPSTDFKALFTVDDSKDMFHRCFFLCERNQQCIGVEICKVKEDLFRCQACCEWKKVKKYGTMSGASNCTYYEQNIEFETNLALKKITTLSSEFDSVHKSSYAVDGIKMCPIEGSASIAASQYSIHPWLSIALRGTYQVKMVKVFARSDVFPNQLDNIRVLVNDKRFNHTCGGQYPGPTEASDAVLFLCASGAIGSKIIILKTTAGTDILGLCEVEVYGTP